MYNLLGKWNDHYRSWTRVKENLLLVKYENLILNPKNELEKIIKFLKQFINFETNENKNNKQVKEFIKFCKKADLLVGEMRQQSNWMTYMSKPVIVDAGITKTNYEIAY